MKYKKSKLSVFLLLIISVFVLNATPVLAEQRDTIQYTIGVVVYNQDSPEMNMFMDYYRDYIQQGFPVKFYFSGSIISQKDEADFIRAMKHQGVNGIISFYGQDIKDTIDVCDEEEIYYVLGSGTLSDEDYDSVKDSQYFLGSVGPDAEAEYEAGRSMAEYFADEDTSSYLLLTGGTAAGNFMHQERSRAILEELAKAEGLTYSQNIDTLLSSEDVVSVETGKDDISLTICPGYMTDSKTFSRFKHVLEENSYDAVLCAYNVDEILDSIDKKEKEQGSNIKVGAVDCFSQENFDAINTEDSFGNPRIDYISGKYASMGGPAFAILYNAMSGHPEANAKDGNSVRLYQGFWDSSGKEEFNELYGYTQDIYENAYSCADLMGVIRVFTEDTTPEKLKALTEAYTVEDVQNRILNQ